MTIRITSCSDISYWYKNSIGREFIVICEDCTEYLVRIPGGGSNIVKIKDAERIK